MTSPSEQEISGVMEILQRTYTSHPMHEAFESNPFHMLIAIVLSQRATDAMTIPVAQHLFDIASTPQKICDLPLHELEQIVRPIGFFHTKSLAVKKLCQTLLTKHAGQVPKTEEELLALPQVGRKTANIMLTMFFHTPQIAVDVHVHRISNRLGWIQTTKVEDTEKILTALMPKKYLPITNYVFVRHGQDTCRPLKPWCSRCPIASHCQRVGVVNPR